MVKVLKLSLIIVLLLLFIANFGYAFDNELSYGKRFLFSTSSYNLNNNFNVNNFNNFTINNFAFDNVRLRNFDFNNWLSGNVAGLNFKSKVVVIFSDNNSNISPLNYNFILNENKLNERLDSFFLDDLKLDSFNLHSFNLHSFGSSYSVNVSLNKNYQLRKNLYFNLSTSFYIQKDVSKMNLNNLNQDVKFKVFIKF